MSIIQIYMTFSVKIIILGLDVGKRIRYGFDISNLPRTIVCQASSCFLCVSWWGCKVKNGGKECCHGNSPPSIIILVDTICSSLAFLATLRYFDICLKRHKRRELILFESSTVHFSNGKLERISDIGYKN